MTEAVLPSPVCGVCGDGIVVVSAVACDRCSCPHHPDCWDFNQGCSIFGCGGVGSVGFEDRARTLATKGLTLSESSRPPLRIGPLLEGLRRKFWARAPFIRSTLPSGIGGSALALLALQSAPSPVKIQLITALTMTGAIYGLLAPFLAPTLLRAPLRFAAAGLVSCFLAFVLMDYLHLQRWAAFPAILLLLLGTLAVASGVTEALAGYRTRVGQALGRGGPLGRGVLAWLTMASTFWFVLSFEDGRFQVDWIILKFCLSIGLIGGAVAIPAMEQGKRAFLEAITPKLPAE